MEYLNSVEVFDLYREQWLPIASMNFQRAFSRTAVVDNSIYLFGGKCSKEKLLNKIEHYDPRVSEMKYL